MLALELSEGIRIRCPFSCSLTSFTPEKISLLCFLLYFTDTRITDSISLLFKMQITPTSRQGLYSSGWFLYSIHLLDDVVYMHRLEFVGVTQLNGELTSLRPIYRNVNRGVLNPNKHGVPHSPCDTRLMACAAEIPHDGGCD